MHPLSSFKYCPRCGSSHFYEKDFKSKKCEDCGFVYYFNSSAAVAAFITDGEGRLMVARRAKDPAKGTFDLPGGFIDLDETAEEALIREIHEETGLEIKDLRYRFSLPNIYTYSNFDVHTVDMFFSCVIEDVSGVCASDDVSEILFLRPDEINPYSFGLTSIRKAIRIFLSKH